ncbi:MAG TPA: DUF4430 domain-containing protein [archaeon]|nr:DUF4430 domain-containing protein [archaeon]
MKNTIIAAILLLVFFSGCSGQILEEQRAPQQLTLQISTYDTDGYPATTKQIQAEEGMSLLAALKHNRIEMELEESSFGAFVNKIEGAIPEENEYVAIYVNGEYAQEGISTLKAENGMEIEFRVEEIKPPA